MSLSVFGRLTVRNRLDVLVVRPAPVEQIVRAVPVTGKVRPVVGHDGGVARYPVHRHQITVGSIFAYNQSFAAVERVRYEVRVQPQKGEYPPGVLLDELLEHVRRVLRLSRLRLGIAYVRLFVVPAEHFRGMRRAPGNRRHAADEHAEASEIRVGVRRMGVGNGVTARC